MNGILCGVLSVIMIAVGGVALYVGSPDSSGSMTIKVGGAFFGRYRRIRPRFPASWPNNTAFTFIHPRDRKMPTIRLPLAKIEAHALTSSFGDEIRGTSTFARSL